MEVVHRAVQHLNRQGDGDRIDHLSAKITTTILILSALVVSAKQYVGEPIQCWVPAEFTRAMEQYTENYCYVQNTYWIGDMRSAIPDQISSRKSAQLNYYQWVPFMLLGQAVMFYTPRVVWRTISALSGINFNALHTMASGYHTSEPVKGDQLKRALANYVISAIELSRPFRRKRSVFYRRLHLYPIFGFLLSKLLYFANATGQLFLLNAILGGSGGAGSGLMGITLIRNLINGTDWSTSGLFPRVTLCDFEIRILGNIHRHTVQCVLMINMFNEKLYTTLWVWTLLVAAASWISLSYWSYQMCLRRKRLQFIKNLFPARKRRDKIDLESGRYSEYSCYKHLALFVDDYLGVDGVFVIHSVDTNAGSVLASQLVVLLYDQFLEDRTRCHNKLEYNNANSTETCCSDGCNGGQYFENTT